MWWWDFREKEKIVSKRMVEEKEETGFDVPVVDSFGDSKWRWLRGRSSR